ncbi:Uncharacterised protein [Haemophilus parahaemolyticus]|uniref:Uncharacterized protein n=1 Tax=Haemophilus parahaemolyticus TaxID=735 RepID=A0A377HY45_HAEPH|nr:hypothetical protein [Haemophilus parahaemolyticus]STO63145.1 Uncharacterised protein [Haemophilus parahaemolyticus]
MSEYTISLAFSVWHHYLKQFTEKHQISLPIFPEQLKKVDISHFLPKAEEIVLGKLPEIHQGRKTLPCSKGDLNNKEADIYYKYQPLYLLEKTSVITSGIIFPLLCGFPLFLLPRSQQPLHSKL